MSACLPPGQARVAAGHSIPGHCRGILAIRSTEGLLSGTRASTLCFLDVCCGCFVNIKECFERPECLGGPRGTAETLDRPRAVGGEFLLEAGAR